MKYLAFLVLAGCAAHPQRPQAAAPVDRLRCECLADPLGIDVATPRLSWVIESEERDQKQTAYQVLVASSRAKLDQNVGDRWDTGKVESDQSVHVNYGGKPLEPWGRCFWKVRVWVNGQPLPWSATASWSMGPQEWKGKWIGKDELEVKSWASGAEWGPGGKKTFEISGAVESAHLLVGSEGEFTVSVNDREVGRGDGGKYATEFFVGSLLHPGTNSFSVTGRRVVAQLHVGPEVINLDGTENRPKPAPGEDRRLPARYLRKEFKADRPIRAASASFSGIGLSELFINGQKVGDHVLSPAWSQYPKRAHYVTHDVTGLLRRGPNAIGVILGNGRFFAPRRNTPARMLTFGYPKLLLQLHLEYEDGSSEDVVSDETWKLSTEGPIRANNEYDGEEYDARMELKGWAEPGFDASSWEAARQVESPGGVVSAQMQNPIRVMQTIKPVSVKQGIYDMGQNISGWCRIKVSGPRGTRVVLRFAETLKPDGTLYRDNLRSARCMDEYILKGEGVEIYEPRFTYRGFRYVEVTGAPPVELEGRLVHDDLERTGAWSCSNPLLNRIYANIEWGLRDNYRSVPTDCPQRDERQGWLGDRNIETRGEMYMFDTVGLHRAWMQHFADAQKPNGGLPVLAPTWWGFYFDEVTWAGGTVVIPGWLLEEFDDRQVIERQYPCMKKWVEHMTRFIKDDIMTRDQHGDWGVPPEDPKIIHTNDPARKTNGMLLGTAFFYYCLTRLVRYAEMLHQPEDAQKYRELAERLKAAFNRRFFKPDLDQYDNGSQTSYVLPLAIGLVPEEHRRKVFERLAEKIAKEGKIVGLVGEHWLMKVLSDNGRADLAYALATQKTYPSWGYMIDKGATTVWELWNGDTADPAMNSHNHMMLVGDLVIWFYEYLAGIQADPSQPGFKHIVMHPHIVGDLTWVKAWHRSIYGLIVSEWKREGGAFEWNVIVPANTVATLTVPSKNLTEGGKPIPSSRVLRNEGDWTVLRVGSGRYVFRSTLP
jgi:alpha-L-rhamnosidase